MPRRSLWFRGGGEAHRGWYRGIWCDSAWELAFLMYCLDHGREIVRSTQNFPYPFRNGLRYYRPDFIVEGTYYEVKGVMDYRSKRKITNFPYPLVVVGEKEIRPFIEYAQHRYGHDYWRLLESPSEASQRSAQQ